MCPWWPVSLLQTPSPVAALTTAEKCSATVGPYGTVGTLASQAQWICPSAPAWQDPTRSTGTVCASTSYGGNRVPQENVVRSADFILMHGNGVKDPKRISEMVRQTRAIPGYRPKPIVFNEDDHFDFDQPDYNLLGAVRAYASWGYFDPEGFQSPPVDWRSATERKRAFFSKLAEITGAK